MLHFKLVFSIFAIFVISCVFGAVTTGLPPTAIRTLNESDVGPEFVPVEQPSARANTDYNGDKDIEGKWSVIGNIGEKSVIKFYTSRENC